MKRRRKLPKKIFGGNIVGRTSRARMKKTCLEDTEEDLREMGIRVWRRKAQYNSEWATIIRQTLVLLGL